VNKEIDTELQAKIKQLPMPEKIKCAALYKHLKQIYSAEKECDDKNRRILYNFNEENKHFLSQVSDIMNGNTTLTDDLLEGKEEFFSAAPKPQNPPQTQSVFERFYVEM
jgi:hypothetical protein